MRAPLVLCVIAGAAFAACSNGSDPDAIPLDGAVGDTGTTTDADGSIKLDTDPPVDTGPIVFSDFPTDPILDGGSLTKAPDFSAGGTATAPCLSEPELGSIFPRNWLRPRFAWSAPADQDVFELRLHVDNQKTDLVVITTSKTWTMPLTMWTALTTHSTDVAMDLSVRGGKLAGTTVSGISTKTSGPLRISPVEAPGSIVYWTTTTKSLKGFKVGEESVIEVLKPAQVTGRTVDC